MRKFLSTTAILLGLSQGASASVVYSFVESGGNVIGTLSGSLNTEFLHSFSDGQLAPPRGISASDGQLISGGLPTSDPRDPSIVSDVTDLSGTPNVTLFPISPFRTFGPGTAPDRHTYVDSSYGSEFMILGQLLNLLRSTEEDSSINYLGLSSDYVSGTPLAGGMTFLNATFDSLGIVQGDYAFDAYVSDEPPVVDFRSGSLLDVSPEPDIILSFGTAVAAVPAPATLPLLLAGLGIVGWRAGRKSTA